MIFEAILTVIKFLIIGVINLFPTIPAIKVGSLDDLFTVFGMIDLIVDVKVLAGCLSVLFVMLNIQLIYGIIMWVVRKIPTVE